MIDLVSLPVEDASQEVLADVLESPIPLSSFGASHGSFGDVHDVGGGVPELGGRFHLSSAESPESSEFGEPMAVDTGVASDASKGEDVDGISGPSSSPERLTVLQNKVYVMKPVVVWWASDT